MATVTTATGVSEAAFQRAVIELAQRQGWRCAHFHDSRRQVRPGVHVGDKAAAGFPDLVLVKARRIILAELKAEKGRLSSVQEDWLWALREVESDAAGRVLVRVWRPSDWPEIEQTLAGVERSVGPGHAPGPVVPTDGPVGVPLSTRDRSTAA